MTKRRTAKGNGRVRPSYLWVQMSNEDRARLRDYAHHLEGRLDPLPFKVTVNRAASILMHEALERFSG
jgi:hypothetical protein